MLVVVALVVVALGCTDERRTTQAVTASEPPEHSVPAPPVPEAQAPPAEAPVPGVDPNGPSDAARALLRAYPDQLCEVTREQVRFCDGSVLPWDDGRADKSFEQKLDDADLEDQLSQVYATGPFVPAPPEHDPGRFRNLAFFKKVYGASAKEVRSKLRGVPWLPDAPQGQLHVTQVNGVDRALAAVAAEVSRLPAQVTAIVAKPAGGFNWREVRGTERLSAHSFGVAVDIGVGFADYWRWQKLSPGAQLQPKNRIPMQVVAAFERHGFIWGGRWHHFDTMHFEYRPELLPPAAETARSGR